MLYMCMNVCMSVCVCVVEKDKNGDKGLNGRTVPWTIHKDYE